MNRNKLKTYAPEARRDFIKAVTERAGLYGLTDKKTEPMTESGGVYLIAGMPFPKAVGDKRKLLEKRISKNGFQPTMEAIAYTWFNRLVALRYMELHGYLVNGFRVLSHPDGHTQPEILEKAQYVDLPGIDPKKVVDLKLDGTKEEDLYQYLLKSQFNALHNAMPFLFEKIDDETELLLPDNLLHSDSLVRKLVNEIDESDWQEVEIIGWLYQFYISERYDEVIGKVVASEDIPAATQLFTPNWIVKYLVQNTLGQQWLATYPQSSLRSKMEYYIEPAEQTPEVQEQLRAITPTSLNPEELTLLDPACGSGHILVEAYDLFKAIYQERGYRARDIPALILKKNLFGLEIDDRAAQLASFALMMKARADASRIFETDAKPNIVALQESKGLDAAAITHALNSPIHKDDVPKTFLCDEIEEEEAGLVSKKVMAQKGHVSQADIAAVVELFEHAKTFGSLIQVPPKLAAKLPEIENRLTEVLKNGDLTHVPAQVLKPLLVQAGLLARQYDVVVANPPYMGNRFLSANFKEFAASKFPMSKTDTYAMFLDRAKTLAFSDGLLAMITMHGWMFLSSFKTLREDLLSKWTFSSLAHFGPRAFSEITGEVVQTAAFVARNSRTSFFVPIFIRLVDGDENDKRESLVSRECRYSSTTQERFFDMPGTPIAYWLPDESIRLFTVNPPVSDVARTAQGLITSDNEQFVRLWHEVSIKAIRFQCSTRKEAAESGVTWFPYNKGGEFRRWYGNNDYIVNWRNDGNEIRNFIDSAGRTRSRPQNMHLYFQPSVTWTDITTTGLATRSIPSGFLFDATGPSAFTQTYENHCLLLSLGNSTFATIIAEVLNPTMHFQPGDFGNLPFIKRSNPDSVIRLVEEAVKLSKEEWDSDETSWGFASLPLFQSPKNTLVEQSLSQWLLNHKNCYDRLHSVELENDKLFAKDADLGDSWAHHPILEKPTVIRRTIKSEVRLLLSYSIGCVMGRYSLDKPGLIYAQGGNQGFDPSQYTTFHADDDGIVPLLDTDWGIPDDAINRFVEFIRTSWSKEHLEENLKFVANSLDPESKESPRETIRHYLATDFYKHHLSMYRRRPIYWLFSSGKQRAFQCLVYLHRYNEGTLSRMRTEYVIPLMGKLNGRFSRLEDDISAANRSNLKRKLEKEQNIIKKQIAEIQTFDDQLRNYANMQIKLDLDDGVKVNHSKFGTLLG